MANPRLRRRGTGTRNVRIKFVLAVEGKTEKAYFEQFQGHVSEVHLMVDTGKGSNPTAVMTQADRMLQKLKEQDDLRPGDQAWIVIDRDRWKREEILEIWEWAKERKDRGIALSLPQFEWWLLLHFEKGSGAGTQQEILKRLGNHIPNYEKGSKAQLPEKPEQQNFAISNAKEKIRIQPKAFENLENVAGSWTTVHFLTEKILQAIKDSSR